jgi:hypothetical protein
MLEQAGEAAEGSRRDRIVEVVERIVTGRLIVAAGHGSSVE